MVKQQIKLPRTSIRIIKGIEEIERHPLLELAEQTPVYVIAGKVYAGKDEVINEVGTIESLDELAMTRIEPALEEVRQAYTSEVWKRVGLEKRLGELDTDLPNLIVNQVFPYLRGEAYKGKVLKLVGEVLKETRQNARTDKRDELDTTGLVEEINKKIKEIESGIDSAKVWVMGRKSEKKRTKKQSRLDNLFGYAEEVKEEEKLYQEGIIQAAVGRENFAVIDGKARGLVLSRNSQDLVLPDGKKYSLGEAVDLKIVEENYRRVVSQAVRKQVLETKFSEEEIRKVLKEKTRHLGKFTGVKKYEEEDFGFTLAKEGSYVYIKIPSFNVGNYSFKKSRIGIKIFKEGKGLNYESYVYRYNEEEWRMICTGSASLPASGKNRGEVIAKRLKQVKAMILAGNTQDWYSASTLINNDYSTMYVWEGAR